MITLTLTLQDMSNRVPEFGRASPSTILNARCAMWAAGSSAGRQHGVNNGKLNDMAALGEYQIHSPLPWWKWRSHGDIAI
jgi:hypothetical protein